MNKKKNIVLAIASIFLLLALLDGWQYGFFTILRFVVFASTSYVSYLAYQAAKEGWTWVMGAVAVLFNPFIPIYLTREIWVQVDFITAIVLIVAIFSLNIDNKGIGHEQQK